MRLTHRRFPLKTAHLAGLLARAVFRDPWFCSFRTIALWLQNLSVPAMSGTKEGAILKPERQHEDAMTKRHEAKYKIDRRMGQNVWGRPKSPVNKREYGPGQHGQRRKSKLSDYGVQLKAKQKLRGYYGNISERQFRGIYDEARRLKGDTGAHLIGLLERRLDAVVYRAKFVPTVFAARQFVNHGHVKVNGSRVNIASYRVKVGDVIEVKESPSSSRWCSRRAHSASATCPTISRSTKAR